MGTIDRFTAEQYITQIFFDYLNALKKAKRNKKKLIPETNVLFEGMDDFKTFIKSPDLQLRVYNKLNLEGLKELFNGCCILAKAYELESYNLVKDCDIIDNEHYFKLNPAVSSFSAGGTYKFNLECMSDTQKKWYQYYGKSWYCYKLNPNTNKYEEYKEGLGEYRALCDTNTNDRAFLFKEPGQYKITASVFQNSINPFDGVFGKLREVETIEINVIDDADPSITNLGLKDKYISAIKYADLGEAFGDLAKDIAAIAGTIILFIGIGVLLKKIPAGKLKPFLTKVAKKFALPELLTFFGTVGDAFDVAAFIGAVCSFDEQVKNAKNEEHLKLAGKTWEKVVETFGLVAVMTFMNVVGRKMKKAEVENEIKAIDDVSAKTVDTTDTLSQKYLENLNKKSINKLTRREDGYEILKKYEAYFGDNIEFVNELIENTPGKEIYVEPEKLLNNYVIEFKKFDNFIEEIKNLSALKTKKEKVLIIQKAFNTLSKNERHLLTIPDDAIFVKEFGPYGRIEYIWPNNQGIKVGSDTSIVNMKGEVCLPDEISRVGDLYGKNFSDAGKHSYDELGLPYRYNPEAYTLYNFNKKSYVEKLNAVIRDDLNELNRLLRMEGMPEITQPKFDAICARYKNIQNSLKNEKLITCDTKYGVKGIVAEFYNPQDFTVKWWNGGAPQFIMPLGANDLLILGIIQ